jgi:hypothetical protein
MIGDFFTKPLQGALFRKFRDIVLGYTHVDSLYDEPPSKDEERVGKGKLLEGRDSYDSNDERSVNAGTGKGKERTVATHSAATRSRVTWSDIVHRNVREETVG